MSVHIFLKYESLLILLYLQKTVHLDDILPFTSEFAITGQDHRIHPTDNSYDTL